MDILVTTPKTEIENARREAQDMAEHGGTYFRTFKRRPAVAPGDRIFFIEDGFIRGYGRVITFTSGQMRCDTTGRIWRGYHVHYARWRWLDVPVIKKGFRGFMYIRNLTAELYQALSNAMPIDDPLPSLRSLRLCGEQK